MLSTSMESRSGFASYDEVRKVFREFRGELEWLAYFITGDEDVAAACVVEGSRLSQCHDQVFQEWLLHWARYATMRSAIHALQSRILRLSHCYAQAACVHGRHEPLSADLLELFVEESDILVSRLDVISRAALVICGIEKHSIREAALFLGVSSACMRAAYCAGLQSLDVLQLETVERKQRVCGRVQLTARWGSETRLSTSAQSSF
jgi:DNA-directed RNA polymerase specialized sigma24 family protein